MEVSVNLAKRNKVSFTSVNDLVNLNAVSSPTNFSKFFALQCMVTVVMSITYHNSCCDHQNSCKFIKYTSRSLQTECEVQPYVVNG